MKHTDSHDLTHAITGIGRIDGGPVWCNGMPIIIGDAVERVDGERMVAVAYLSILSDASPSERIAGDWWLAAPSIIRVASGSLPHGTCGAVHPSGALERECTGVKGHAGDHPWRL